MKKKAEIQAYLKTIRPKKEVDYLAIQQYCLRWGINYSISDRLAKDSDKKLVSYEDFRGWVGDDEPSQGEVIVLDDDKGVGLVKNSYYDSITFHVLLTPGQAPRIDNISIPRNGYRNASKKDWIRIQKTLSEHNLDYNRRKGVLVDKMMFSNGKFARVTLLGKKIGFGIIREIKDDGTIIMYIFKPANNFVRYSLAEEVGNFYECQLETVSRQERAAIAKDLASKGLFWKGHTKRVEPMNFRLPQGSPYYFINIFFQVKKAYDKRNKRNDTHVYCSNYFHSIKEAQELLAELPQNKPIRRSPIGQKYYTISNYLNVAEVIEKGYAKDLDRFNSGNYFHSEERASRFLHIFLDRRKKQLLRKEKETE